MPPALDRHLYPSISRYTTYVRHVVFQRLKRANLPLLIAFVSSLFVFLRALSGAGYVDPTSEPVQEAGLNYTQLDSGEHAYVGFAEHWARFKESFLSCPEGTIGVTVTDVVGEGSGLDLDDQLGGPGMAASPARRVGIKCLKDRLTGVIGLRKSKSNGDGRRPAVKQEDRNFGISLDGITSRRKREGLDRRAETLEPLKEALTS